MADVPLTLVVLCGKWWARVVAAAAPEQFPDMRLGRLAGSQGHVRDFWNSRVPGEKAPVFIPPPSAPLHLAPLFITALRRPFNLDFAMGAARNRRTAPCRSFLANTPPPSTIRAGSSFPPRCAKPPAEMAKPATMSLGELTTTSASRPPPGSSTQQPRPQTPDSAGQQQAE